MSKQPKPKFISKKELIKALESEPLFPGTWINKELKPGETCAVCEVGSIVRTKLHASEKAVADDGLYTPKFNSAAERLVGGAICASDFRLVLSHANEKPGKAFKNIIETDGYWSALSSYFEYLGEDLLDVQHSVMGSTELLANERDLLNQALITQCNRQVVPELIKMVNKYFPNRIPLNNKAGRV